MTTNADLAQRRAAAIPRGLGNALQVYADRARNAEIWDVEGRRYIDFASGIAVLNTGHLHAKVAAAVEQQLTRFSHACFQVTPYESYVALAERLNALMPGPGPNKTLFLSSGAEAVENAIKIARYHTGRSGVVAFSGGADSAFLAAVAHRTLGDTAHAVTAVSPSLAGDEEADCRALATEWGLRWTPVVTNEMERAAYRTNDLDRCYHCKAELMDVVGPIAAAEGATVVLGVNLDDLGDHRPGQRAAAEAGAEFPLVAAGFTKADVRAASQQLGLRTWDKPAAACLASRIPYGTEVSVGLLSQVDRAESALRRLGFRELRVRHYGDTARIELDTDELAAALAARAELVDAVKACGFRYVTLDLEGFRSGNLNPPQAV